VSCRNSCYRFCCSFHRWYCLSCWRCFGSCRFCSCRWLSCRLFLSSCRSRSSCWLSRWWCLSSCFLGSCRFRSSYGFRSSCFLSCCWLRCSCFLGSCGFSSSWRLSCRRCKSCCRLRWCRWQFGRCSGSCNCRDKITTATTAVTRKTLSTTTALKSKQLSTFQVSLFYRPAMQYIVAFRHRSNFAQSTRFRWVRTSSGHHWRRRFDFHRPLCLNKGMLEWIYIFDFVITGCAYRFVQRMLSHCHYR